MQLRSFTARLATFAAVPLCTASLAFAQPSASPAPSSPSDSYRADADSGAVSFRVGDVFRGPGPVTIGYLGAKKQLLLPNGEWRVLAAVDYRSEHASPMPLTAVAFGQFDGDHRLRSLLVSVSTRRPGRNTNTWAVLSHCQADTGGSLWQAAQERYPLSHCTRVQALAPGRLRAQLPPALVESLDQQLPALGAAWPDANLRTTMVVTNAQAALLLVQRFDCVGGAPAGACTPLPRGSRDRPSPALRQRLDWARAYAGVAPLGMVKDLPADELEALPVSGTAAPVAAAAAATAGLSLPD